MRASALALLILGFLALVTLAASGARRTGHAHLAERQVPNTLQDSWVTLMTITYVVVIVAVLVRSFRRRDGGRIRALAGCRTSVVILVVMALFTGAGFCAVKHGHFREQSSGAADAAGKAQARPREETPLG